MEISLNIETEVFVEFSFAWLTLPVLIIDYFELLVDLSGFGPDNKVSVFSINTTRDIHDFLVVITDKVWGLPLEELPPSRVGAPDLHVA